MTELDRNKTWALRSIQAEWMAGARGPANFVSALVGVFDADEEDVYRSLVMRYPYGPAMLLTCARIGARTFPAAADDERLRKIGVNYQLPRFPTESGTSYEKRLGLAWTFHAEGGTSIAVRKALEAYGFAEINILEECYYNILPVGASYHWAWTVVLGPTYGDAFVAGMVIGSWVLGNELSGHLGVGNLSAAQIDDIIRIMLTARQSHDCPMRLIFRFGDVPLLGLITLGSFVLGGSPGSGVAIREIQARHCLGSWYLGTSTFKGFGV